MDDSMAATAAAAAAAVCSTNFYGGDLVSYRSVRGLAAAYSWASAPSDKLVISTADGAGITKEAGDADVALLDRSYLHAGGTVVSASSDLGQIGVVTGVTTVVDLVELNDSGEAIPDAVVVRDVPPCDLRRVRALSLGDYVVSGTWLGRVVEVSLDVDVVFDDGALCRVSDAESKEQPRTKRPYSYYRPQENPPFYRGMRVITAAADPFFTGSGSRWLKGHKKLHAGEEGTVARVEMAGVLVRWIALAHLGTDRQLVEEEAPPAYQDPDNLTFFCSDWSCFWALGDRCFLKKSNLTAPAELNTKKEEEERSTHRKRKPTFLMHPRAQRNITRSAPLSTMTVSNTHTIVDVLWQDGTRQHEVPSTSLNPFIILNEDEVFPGQHVVDATVGDDDVLGVASTRRIGVVKSVNANDHTLNVSWFKADSLPDEANVDTISAYDLVRYHDHCIFYGDVVVRLLPNINGSTPLVQQPLANCNKRAPNDLSWVGHVVDLLHDRHVQVKWGDGSTSTVLPHEISVANKEYYQNLQAEMGDWVEKEEEEEEEDNADPSQEFGAANTDIDPQQADATNVEGGGVEASQGSVNEFDGSATTRTGRFSGFIQSMIRALVQVLARGKCYPVKCTSSSASDLLESMQNVEVPTHASTGTYQDPSIVGATTEASFALVTGSDASADEDDSDEGDSDEDVVKAREDNGDVDPSSFPHFDVVQSPRDHHYLANMDQSSSGGKSWVKAVQKEWKILENSLPDTIYVRAYEERMDLLRAAMAGASGTPYQGGLFFFDLQLPPAYPDEPPQVYYHSFGVRLNPNLHESGTVCLSLLDTFGGEGTELWSPGTSSLLQVVVSIQALVLNDQPFYNEDGYKALVGKPEGQHNTLPYSENAYLLTLRTALHLLRRPPQGFEGFVRDHFRRRGRAVLSTCEAYLRGCVLAEEGSMKLPCSAGFRITLANLVPRLVAAFKEIGVEWCDQGLAQQTLI